MSIDEVIKKHTQNAYQSECSIRVDNTRKHYKGAHDKAYSRRYRMYHFTARKRSTQRYRKRNRNKVRAQERRYYHKNLARSRANSRRYYKRHRAKIIAKKKIAKIGN